MTFQKALSFDSMQNPISALVDAFDAEQILTVYEAADQDGYKGGWVASDGTLEAHGETPEQAKLALRQGFGLQSIHENC